MPNSNGNSATARWIATVVAILVFAGTVAFAAVQTSMNAQLNSRIKRVDQNVEEISAIKAEFRALSSVLEEKFKNLEKELNSINRSLDKLTN